MSTAVKAITAVKRMPNTPMGNARYVVTFHDGTTAWTSRDSSVANQLRDDKTLIGPILSVQFNGNGRITALAPYTPKGGPR